MHNIKQHNPHDNSHIPHEIVSNHYQHSPPSVTHISPGSSFSTLTQMYSTWLQYDVPVTFYHYFLSVLKTKSKSEQQILMNREIASLRTGTHLYLQLKSAITARESSLRIIIRNLPLFYHESAHKKGYENANKKEEEYERLGYRKLFQTNDEKQQQSAEDIQLRELSNHLVIYRKITLQIIFLVNKWIAEIRMYGYEGQIQFLYQTEDYLENITDKVMPIINEYSEIFQLNPFFILKRSLEKGELALIYNSLKISPSMVRNLYEGLKLLAQHHTDLLRYKMLQKQVGSNRKISKPQSLEKLYSGILDRGQDYYLVKDSALKAERVIKQQDLYLDKHRLRAEIEGMSDVKKHNIIESYKGLESPPILVNPEVFPQARFQERKRPIYVRNNDKDQIEKGLGYEARNQHGHHYKDSASNTKPIKVARKNLTDNPAVLRRNSESLLKKNMLNSPPFQATQPNVLLSTGKINHKKSLITGNPLRSKVDWILNNGLNAESKIQMLYEMDKQRLYGHKDDGIGPRKRISEGNNDMKATRTSGFNYRGYSRKSRRRSEMTVEAEEDEGNCDADNPRMTIKRTSVSENKSKQLQKSKMPRQMSITQLLQSQVSVDYVEAAEHSSNAMRQKQIPKLMDKNLKMIENLELGSIKNSMLIFEAQKALKPTQIVRHLRYLFKQEFQNPKVSEKGKANQGTPSSSSSKMTPEGVQKLAKALLSKKQSMTMFKIKYKDPSDRYEKEKLVAWIVVRMYRDESTFDKTVDLVFIYQFKRLLDLRGAIINYFHKNSYGLVRENGIVISDLTTKDDIKMGTQILRSKYKVSPYATSEEVATIIKDYKVLKMSRILKYHSYSKTTKYHRFCEHKTKEMMCSLGYYFETVEKLKIDSNDDPMAGREEGYGSFIKCDVDWVKRFKECYIIHQHLNSTFLVVAKSMDDLFKFEKESSKRLLQEDSSFELENGEVSIGGNLHNVNKKGLIESVCFEECKVMKKYVTNREKPILTEFLWIENNIIEERSFMADMNSLQNQNVLVIEKPYVLGIYMKDNVEGYKSLVLMDFIGENEEN